MRYALRHSPGLATLLLLLAAVVLPMAGMSWLLFRGVASERLASEHRLMRAQQTRLEIARAVLEGHWQQLDGKVSAVLQRAGTPALHFQRLLQVADSAILLDESGAVSYPDQPRPPALNRSPGDSVWEQARGLEAVGDLAAASETYAVLAARSWDHHRVARALLGQARCLARNGDTDEALAIIRGQLLQEKLAGARDSSGRLIAPAAQLMAIRLLNAPDLLGPLAVSLRDYRNAMPSSQRSFLMAEAAAFDSTQKFPTRAAESLAQTQVYKTLPARSGLSRITAGAWAYRPAESPCLLLFRSDSLQQQLEAILGDVQILAPGVSPPANSLQLAASRPLADWQLSIPKAIVPQTQRYALTGLGLLLLVFTCGTLAALSFRSQLRLAQLKHTLVSTVSHELKTPLASTQMLVDTLLGELELPPERQQEYLRTIAQENQRLSRLVESFLTFSRMERNQHQFDIQPVPVCDIVELVQSSVASRIDLDACDFAIDNKTNGICVHADADAILSALLNLIENASKYSASTPHIRLEIHGEDDITFTVADQGVGLSPHAAKSIFRQFYQVDQSLTREQDGCGLGLSIVRYIMNAHDTRIAVDSELGKGSSFRFSLPAVRELI